MATARVGSVYAEIRARLDKFERDLNKAQGKTIKATTRIQRSLDKISFDRAAKSLMNFVGVYAGARGIGTLIRMGSDYEQSIFQMSQTFQGETDKMISVAKRMSASFKNYYNFNDIAYAFTKTADSMERYGIVGDKYLELVRRAADIGAAKNLELKESIDRIESAMRGEAEASEYLGLTLNDTYMKSIAFDGALKDTWETMSDLEKAQYRFNELMNQSTKYTGSAEKATNTFSGAIKALSNAIENRLNKTLLSSNSIITKLIVSLREMWEMPEKLSKLDLLKKQQEDLIHRQEVLNKAISEIGRSKTPGKQQYLDRLFQKLRIVQGSLAIVSQDMRKLKKESESVGLIVSPGGAGGAGGGPPSDMIFSSVGFEHGTPGGIGGIGTTRGFEHEKKAMDDFVNYAKRAGEDYKDHWLIKAEEKYEVQSRSWDALIHMEKEKFEWLTTLSERTAWSMQQNFSNFFFDAMHGKFESLKDFATGVLDSISRALSDLSAQWLTSQLFGGLTSGSGGGGLLASLFHGGGVVGGGGSVRRISAAAFIGAPRLHKGLMPDEYPAILQRGETVIPRGGGNISISVPVTVNGAGGDAGSLQNRLRSGIEQTVRDILAQEMR